MLDYDSSISTVEVDSDIEDSVTCLLLPYPMIYLPGGLLEMIGTLDALMLDFVNLELAPRLDSKRLS